MWERWRKGESLQQIAKLFDRNHSSIQRILAETDGIRPALRHRCRLALTLAEHKRFTVATDIKFYLCAPPESLAAWVQ
jgi:uncharacterized protein YqiB (DUF1249 family)